MTNYNEKFNEALCNHRGRVLTYHELYRKQHHNPHRLDADLAHADAVAKQDITSLIKELIEDAKPSPDRYVNYNSDCLDGYNLAIKDFEHNLLKELEEDE